MSKSKLKYVALSIVCIHILLSSCRDRYILSEKQMREVLYDIELIQALPQIKQDVYMSQEQKDALLAGVLKKHDITKEMLDSSLVWYSDRIEIYRRIRDSVNSNLEKEQRHYGELLNRESLLLNKGSFPSYFYLTPEEPVFRFNLDSLLIVPLGLTAYSDLNFKLLGVSPELRIQSSLYFRYNDTAFTHTGYIDDDSIVLNLNILPDRRLLDFAGYIRVDSAKTDYRILVYDYRLNNDSVKNLAVENIQKQQIINAPLHLRRDEMIKE